MPSSSSSSSSTTTTSSLTSLLQYTVLGIIGYLLAGAPQLSLLTGTGSTGASYSSAGSSAADAKGGGGSSRGFESLVFPEGNLSCGEHRYKGVYVLGREPLVVYIEGFLTEEESRHVVGVSDPLFTPSTIWTASTETLDRTIRNSEKAPLPRDETVKCIEDRARRFQGWHPYTFIEKLWAQRYGPGGHYTYHYDWSTATKTAGRVSSFMVYLAANCTGGGTHFPRLERPRGEGAREWCRFIECGDEGEGEETKPVDGKAGKVDLSQGIIFKPIAGNAIFWENMRRDGSGYWESWHAGLPVESGVKIGLNIWSWFQEGLVAPAQEQEQGQEQGQGQGQE